MKLKVPQDVAVIGFSNEPFTNFLELSISTIDQFPLEMGKMTAKVFLEQIDSSEVEKIQKKVVLEPKLIIRKSSNEENSSFVMDCIQKIPIFVVL